MMQHLMGVPGILLILATMYLWSENRRNISWRLVLTTLGLLFAGSILFLKVPGTSDLVILIGAGAQKMATWATDGMDFAFGKSDNSFARNIFGMMVLVCGVCELLYYLRVLPVLVKILSFGFRKLGLGGAESLSCAGTPFLGQVEAQLLIKHFLSKLTPSALLTCMTTSMSTTAGSALLLYISIGLKPQYLITVSMMNCLSGIILSKMKRPASRQDLLSGNDVQPEPSAAHSVFDAAEKGAMHGARIAFSVIVMVIFYIAFMDMSNSVFAGGVSLFGFHASLQDVLGMPFAPVAYLIGIPWDLCLTVGRLMATGAIFNEVVAMMEYMKLVHAGGLTERTQLLITCVITIFAHPCSIGIQIGGLKAMAPERAAEIVRNAPLAMVIATMSAWLTACVCSCIF